MFNLLVYSESSIVFILIVKRDFLRPKAGPQIKALTTASASKAGMAQQLSVHIQDSLTAKVTRALLVDVVGYRAAAAISL